MQDKETSDLTHLKILSTVTIVINKLESCGNRVFNYNCKRHGQRL